MIKRSIIVLTILMCSATGVFSATSATPLVPLPKHALSATIITQLIDRYHYKSTQLNDTQSRIILEHYIDNMDPSRSIFTIEDVNSFNRFKTRLDDALLKGDLSPAFIIFRLYNQRRVERAEYALQRLQAPFDFTLDETYLFDRSEEPWAKNKKALDELWRKRVKNDVLSLLLADKTDDEIKKTLGKRYARLKNESSQFNSEDTYEFFINTYLRSVEPHTGYFSPRASENFKINMSLSLEGIGAVLQTIDEHTVVQRIVTGGPADLAGELHAEDRIIGVAQGDEGSIEDVVGWRIDDVVDLIRGPKGSKVRLQILAKDSGLDGPSKEIIISRDRVKLEKQQVKKSIIELPNGNKTTRIGVITIPMFYVDFDAADRGDKDYRSTTRDTRVVLEELQAEGIDGLIVDLRGNGGGSLTEAVSLTGLFIRSGPVVQVREKTGKLELKKDEDRSIAYIGRLAVLVDRFSASASEIFAGAMQDYGRGIVVGEPTFGKGTVQSVIDLNRFVKRKDFVLGKLKITMAQFFRVNGESTQHRGVIPDIIFPTAVESDDQGERSLENALPWANISAAKFTPFNSSVADLSNIKLQHEARAKRDSGFIYLVAQAEVQRKVLNKKQVTLLKTQRQIEREKLETEQRERLNNFRISRGLKPQKKDDDSEMSKDSREKLSKELDEIELRETAAILIDVMKMPLLGKDKLSLQKISQTNR